MRAEKRDAKSILGAMKRGDFYASTGVELTDVVTGKEVAITIKPKSGAHYRTTFSGRDGQPLAESDELTARYTVRGDEGYVRAKVIDSNGKARMDAAGVRGAAMNLTVSLAVPLRTLVLIGGGEFSFGETREVDELLLAQHAAGQSHGSRSCRPLPDRPSTRRTLVLT